MHRTTVTRASRIMLPAHAAFSTALGTAWVLQADERTAIPSLYALREIWPIQATGGVLLGLGVLGVVAMLTHRRTLAATCLMAGCIGYVLLTVAILWSLPVMPTASYSAWLWPAYVASAHLATVLSLAADEYTDEYGTNRRRA